MISLTASTLANFTVGDWTGLCSMIIAIGTIIAAILRYIIKHSDFNSSLKANTNATNNLTKAMTNIQTHLNTVDIRLQSHEDSIRDHEYRLGRLEGANDLPEHFEPESKEENPHEHLR